MRDKIDEILARPSLGEEELAFLSENIAELTEEEKKNLGFIKPLPAPGPEIPADQKAELVNEPVRTPEEVEKTSPKEEEAPQAPEETKTEGEVDGGATARTEDTSADQKAE